MSTCHHLHWMDGAHVHKGINFCSTLAREVATVELSEFKYTSKQVGGDMADVRHGSDFKRASLSPAFFAGKRFSQTGLEEVQMGNLNWFVL